MKKILFILLLLISFSCTKEDTGCSGTGEVTFTNKSIGTVQKIMIDGVGYGSIDPGESKTITLAAGEYEFQMVGISGGPGCSVAKFHLAECQKLGYSCNGK